MAEESSYMDDASNNKNEDAPTEGPPPAATATIEAPVLTNTEATITTHGAGEGTALATRTANGAVSTTGKNALTVETSSVVSTAINNALGLSVNVTVPSLAQSTTTTDINILPAKAAASALNQNVLTKHKQESRVKEQVKAQVAGPLQQQKHVKLSTLALAQYQEQQEEQQQQQRQLQIVTNMLRTRPSPSDCEQLFPHIAETHRQIRRALVGLGEGTFQQKMMNAIKQYISGCRDEYDEAIMSTLKCRKLARSLARTMDLLQNVCTNFLDSYEYLHHMSALVAIYISCELSYAQEFKEHKPMIANRISNIIHKHLRVTNEDIAKANVLRMFVYIPKMYKEREVMTKIFQEFIPKPQVLIQQELPDNIYIQYIIVFYQWKQLEIDLEEQMRVIDFADKFMRPAKSLCSNTIYAHHLPKYESRRTATKFILQNLKFFHDLRNASIYENCLKSATGVIDLSDDYPIDKPTEKINFADIVDQTHVDPAVQTTVKLEKQIVLATIDLTLEDEREQCQTAWLRRLQMCAQQLAPTRQTAEIFAGRQAILANAQPMQTSEIIQLDSDSDEDAENENEKSMTDSHAAKEPELFSLDFEEPERIDCDDVFYEGDLSDNSFDENFRDGLTLRANVHADPTQVTNRFQTNIRTYAAPKEKQQQKASKEINSVWESDKSRSSSSYTSLSSSQSSLQHMQQTKTPRTTYSSESFEPSEERHKTLPLNCTTASTTLHNSMPQYSHAQHFTMPRIVDSYSCRRDSIHMLPTPITNAQSSDPDEQSAPEQEQEQDMIEHEYDMYQHTNAAPTSHKVVYSQAMQHLPAHSGSETQFETDGDYNYIDAPDYPNDESVTKEHTMQFETKSPQPKKQVKFNEYPIGPTRPTHSACEMKRPIKPAITTSKQHNQHVVFTSASLPRFTACASPASSTSSIGSESLKQLARKEHIDAIGKVFSTYDIFRQQEKSSNPTVQALHNSRSRKPRESAINSAVTNLNKQVTIRRLTKSYSPIASHSSDSLTSSSTCASLQAKPSQLNVSDDPKLKKKCSVVIERYDQTHYRNDQVAFINELLEMQREKQRQRAIERQRQREDHQRLLHEERQEQERLKLKIKELKRQQAEKELYQKALQDLKRKEEYYSNRFQIEQLRKKHLEHENILMQQKEMEFLTRLSHIKNGISSGVEDYLDQNSSICNDAAVTKKQTIKIRSRSETIDDRKVVGISSDSSPSYPKYKATAEADQKVESNETLLQTSKQTTRPRVEVRGVMCDEAPWTSPARSAKPSTQTSVTTPQSATKPLKILVKRTHLKTEEMNKIIEETPRSAIDVNTDVVSKEIESERRKNCKGKRFRRLLANEERNKTEEVERVDKEIQVEIKDESKVKPKTKTRLVKRRLTAIELNKEGVLKDTNATVIAGTKDESPKTVNQIKQGDFTNASTAAEEHEYAITNSAETEQKHQLQMQKQGTPQKAVIKENSPQRTVSPEKVIPPPTVCSPQRPISPQRASSPRRAATANKTAENRATMTASPPPRSTAKRKSSVTNELHDERGTFAKSGVDFKAELRKKVQKAKEQLKAQLDIEIGKNKYIKDSVYSDEQLEVYQRGDKKILFPESEIVPHMVDAAEITKIKPNTLPQTVFEKELPSTQQDKYRQKKSMRRIVHRKRGGADDAAQMTENSNKVNGNSKTLKAINETGSSAILSTPSLEQLRALSPTAIAAMPIKTPVVVPLPPLPRKPKARHTKNVSKSRVDSVSVENEDIAANSLTLLANTAAITAPLSPNIKKTTSTPPETPEAATVTNASIINEDVNNETATSILTATLIAAEVNERSSSERFGADLPFKSTPIQNHRQITDELSRNIAELAQIVQAAVAKETAVALLNLEATPTVPPYLFNGESRDVPTPTLINEQVTVDIAAFNQESTTAHIAVSNPAAATVDSSSLAATEIVISALSTSDHEVSSTQETVYETSKRNQSTQSKAVPATELPIVQKSDATALLVQNNQVDTTHHLPEFYTHITRRRARKLSTIDEERNLRPVSKRRKTFCAESNVRPPSPDELPNISSGLSPSTTTAETMEKPLPRRRGRPAKNSNPQQEQQQQQQQQDQQERQQLPVSIPMQKLRNVTLATALPLARTNCDSPGELPTIKRTYTKSNVAQKVFVPREIEECLADSETDMEPEVETTVTDESMSTTDVDNNVRHTGKKHNYYTTVKGARVKVFHKPNAKAPKSAHKTTVQTTRGRRKKSERQWDTQEMQPIVLTRKL